MAKSILVLGGTGRQGGAVARHLLRRDWDVVVLTRRPESPHAQAMVQLGARLAKGDLDDEQSLESALEGIYGLFVVTDCWEHGLEREVSQAKRVLDAAKRAGVQHVVYGSVAGARDPAAPPHFLTKGSIEQHIEAIELPYTFLRPTFFMEMFDVQQRTAGWRTADLLWSFMRRALGDHGTVQLIAVDDIGHAAADAFDDPADARNTVVKLAGDALTFAELDATLKRHLLRRPYVVPGPFLFVARWTSVELRHNFKFIETGGWQIDIDAGREARPWLRSFDQWAGERTNAQA